jgi:hypothetical protein
MPFATINKSDHRLELCVLQPSCSDTEFSDFADRVAEVYVSMPPNFVLSIDMMKMNRLPLQQAMKWMTMFHKVSDVTKERLVATCICFHDPLVKISTDLFLTFYNPIKPLHIFESSEECEDQAKKIVATLKE